MSKKTEAVDLETAQAVEKANHPQDYTIELSTGVVLRGKQAPPLILIQVMASKPRPEPPVYHNDKMGRDIENPDDPAYQESLKAWQMDNSNKLLNALILLGTELVSAPKGMPGPQSDAWLDEYGMLGMPTFPENKSWRYLTWVKFKAVKDEHDLERIKDLVGKLSGIRETDVRATESFPGRDQTDR